MDESDEEAIWIQKSQQGDPEAFEALVERYQRMIHSLAYRMVGSLTEAEDLAQETFIQAYQHLGHFRREAKFSSWLYRITINLCLNWRQHQQRHHQAFAQWSQERAEQVMESPSSTETELSHQVQAALARLHPKQRAAIVLTVYEGFNHAEAAQALGCSETTVSWRLFAARRKLKRWLQPFFVPSQTTGQVPAARSVDTV